MPRLNTVQTIYLTIKDILDPILAAFLFLFLSPLFLYLAFRIINDSDGPIFAPKQIRLGRYGKPFFMYKFRTMYTHFEKTIPSDKYTQNMFKDENDSRITPFGKFLRENDLDELPQLINVIIGEMHIIGPRCFTPVEEQYYKKYFPKLRHLINLRKIIKPGITGLWQVSGRNSTTLEQRLNLDNTEVEKVGPSLDSKILTKTITKFFTKRWE